MTKKQLSIPVNYSPLTCVTVRGELEVWQLNSSIVLGHIFDDSGLKGWGRIVQITWEVTGRVEGKDFTHHLVKYHVTPSIRRDSDWNSFVDSPEFWGREILGEL